MDGAPSADALLEGLGPDQQAAVTNDAGSLCVVAGAGSGKTTVLTRRVAWRVRTDTAQPEHVLVVTFTRKAASELRQRLARLGAGAGAWAGTFHAAAFAQLRRHWADTGRHAPGLVPDPLRILRDVVAAEPGLGADALDALATELSWARARMIEPGRYAEAATAAGRATAIDLEQVARVLERYGKEKRRRSVLDLDDLVVECARMVEAGGPSAAAVHWRVRHLFVDEFQDVNPAQWRLLSAWRNGRDDLCVVGDPRQAVYSWNGADPTLLARLPELVPGTVVVRLDENRRCSPPIVAAASAVLAAGAARGDAGGPGITTPVAADGGDGPLPTVLGFDDEDAEAAAVIRWLRTTRRPGEPWHHHAVLARTNARLEPIADALREAGIPFRRAGRRDEGGDVAEVVRRLRAASRGQPLRAVLVDVLAEVLDHRAGPEAAPASSSVEVPDLFERLADEYAADEPGPTVGGFLGWLAANPGATELPGARRDVVELATFHRAKGLEWTAVAVVGCEDGTVPIAYAQDDQARAEERRLFYVALTRARRDLWCSWSARTGQAERARTRRPSPFLEAVRRSTSAAGPPPADVVAAHLADLRSRLAVAG